MIVQPDYLTIRPNLRTVARTVSFEGISAPLPIVLVQFLIWPRADKRVYVPVKARNPPF